VIIYVAGCDEEAAENIIQDLINIWSGNAEIKSEKHDEHSKAKKDHNVHVTSYRITIK
jgi:predicted SpoU family rRNA methylase